jgi:hypothetical protein
MLVLPTAKILLFLAMNLGPHNASLIYATSKSESYVWDPTPTGWALTAKAFPASDFTRDPEQTATFDGQPRGDVPGYIRSVSRYNWNRDGALVFENGDRVEKHGDHAFYIINAGGANEKVFTIFFPVCKKS